MGQSVHKTLGVLSGGALLHVVSDRLDAKRIRTYLAMFQTSNPCHRALAALECAVLSAQELQKNYGNLTTQIESARERVNVAAKAYWDEPEHKGSFDI